MRSHYDRSELETLFELQPRAAQKLTEMLPSVRLGTSRLIEREALVGFLDRVQDADDVAVLFQQIRAEKTLASRRKLRSLVRRDLEPISLTSLPCTIQFSRGQLTISFETVEQLAENLLLVARILESEGEELAAAYEKEGKGRWTQRRRRLQRCLQSWKGKVRRDMTTWTKR